MKTFTTHLEYLRSYDSDLIPALDFIFKGEKEEALTRTINALKPMIHGSIRGNINYNGVQSAICDGKRYHVVAIFKNSQIHKSLVEGCAADFVDDCYHEFPKWGALCLAEGDENLYFGVFYERYSPNWNNKAEIIILTNLSNILAPIVPSIDGIKSIDANVKRLLRESMPQDYKDILNPSGESEVNIIDDRSGKRLVVCGPSLDAVFRDIADNHMGWRDYRHPDSREYFIANDDTRAAFNEWKKTANGLKSSFDKFYRGGIVD